MRNSFDYTKRSPLHKRQSRNRFFKKLSFVCLMMGGLLLLIAVVLAAVLPFRALSARDPHQTMALSYAGAGIVFLLLYWVVERIRDWNIGPLDSTRSKRRAAYRRGAKADRKRRKRPIEFIREHEMPDPSSDKQGAVLIMVLVLLALVTGLVLQTQASARNRLKLHQAQVRETQLRLAATEGIRQAFDLLTSDADLQVDHLLEPWTTPIEYVDPNQVAVRVVIVDENRFFDVNNLAVPYPPNSMFRSPRDIYMDILNQCGEFSAVALGDALTDWVDSDEIGLKEKPYYLAKDPPLQPSDRIMVGWNELLLIDGYERDSFDRKVRNKLFTDFEGNLIDSITVLPLQRASMIPINVNTVDKATLRGVLGIGFEAVAETILTARLLQPIRNVNDLLPPDDPNALERWRPYISIRSTYFRVLASAFVDGHSEQVEVLALRDGSGDMQVLQWVF